MDDNLDQEIAEIMETAMLKEVASAATYRQAASHVTEPSVATLLEELATEEDAHLSVLKNLKPEKIVNNTAVRSRLSDLKLAEHLKAPESLEGADLTDTLLYAIKREAESVAFYTDLMGVYGDENAKNLCQALAWQELAHKARLELLYDHLAFPEN